MNMDAEVTATEAAAGLPDVSRQLIAMWVRHNKLTPIPGRRRGRSPLYRWGDVLDAESKARESGLGRPRATELPTAA